MAELDEKALAVSFGLTWGIAMLLLGWSAAFAGLGTEAVELLASFYVGFEPSFVGGILGAVYGAVDGVIGGYLIAFFYNQASERL